MPEPVSEDDHGDFGTEVTTEEETLDAGSTDVEMNLQEEKEDVPENQDVSSEMQEALDEAAEHEEVTQYDSHRDAVEAATGGEYTSNDGVSKEEATVEDFRADLEDEQDSEATQAGSETTQDKSGAPTSTSPPEDPDREGSQEVEDLPETTSSDLGIDEIDEDGQPDFSALKGTEEEIEEVTRNGTTFEFVFQEPENSDDEIINMVRDLRGDGPGDNRNRDEMTAEEEAEAEQELRKEAALQTIQNYDSEVIAEQWEDFAGSVKLQLGGKGLQVLGLMDFIKASGAGPAPQQDG